jgi:predicted metalloprotease with PDZ domain
VFGTEAPDYDSIFGYAGYRVEKKAQATPDFGFSIRPRNGGFAVNGVETGGAAATAGLKVGDIIIKINGDSPFTAPFGTFAGREIKLTLTRGGEEMELPMKVRSIEFTGFSLAEVQGATPQQVKIREGWLKRQ